MARAVRIALVAGSNPKPQIPSCYEAQTRATEIRTPVRSPS